MYFFIVAVEKADFLFRFCTIQNELIASAVKHVVISAVEIRNGNIVSSQLFLKREQEPAYPFAAGYACNCRGERP